MFQSRRYARILMMVAVLVSCSILLSGGIAGYSAEKPTIKTAWMPYGPHSIPLLAEERGWYDELGVNVPDVPMFMSAPPMHYAIAAGEVMIGSGGATPALVAAAQNMYPLYIIAVNVDVTPMYRVAALPEYDSFQDLKGKKIGVSVGTTDEYWFLTALDKFGWTKDDVQVVHLEQAESQTALVAGRIDAAVVNPTVAYTLEQKGLKVITGPDFLTQKPGKIIDQRIYNLVYCRKDWADKNPLLVVKWLAAYFKGAHYWMNNMEEANEWGRQKMESSLGTEFTPESYRRYVTGFYTTTLEDNVKIYMNPDHPMSAYQNLPEELQFLIETGKIEEVPDIKKVLNNQFVMDLWNIAKAVTE